MVNHGYEQALERQGKVIVSLMREIDYKNQKLMEMEHKYKDTAACMRKLIEGLTENINSKQRSLLEMEHKCNESYALVRRLMNEKYELSEGYQKELQRMKDMNNLMNETAEYQKKEHGELRKKLEQQQLNLTEEIEKLKKELQDQHHVESQSNWITQINALGKELEDKREDMEYLESLNRMLMIKESKYKQELCDARKESINSSQDMFKGRSQLGIKRLGELDQKPFQDACFQKYSNDQWQEISAQLCSSWEESLKDPHWHPFKKVKVNGMLQEIIDENDEKLKGLRMEYGDKVYEAVVNALMELEECNPSGRYAISEVWNWKEGRQASLKEIIQYIIRQLKTHKRKRKSY